VTTPSLFTARVILLTAAVLWSSGSFFIRLFQESTILHLDEPRLSPIQLAFYRALFAGLCLVPLIRRPDMRFRPRMAVLMILFAAMNAMYLSAVALGPAATAILLQNTSPVWVYLVGVYVLAQPKDTRSFRAIMIGLLGAMVLVVGNWPRGLPPESQAVQIDVLLMGLGSGLTYAGVVLLLGSMRTESPAWLTLLNLLGTAIMIAIYLIIRDGITVWWAWVTVPTWQQLCVLAIFGSVQLAAPYVLFTRGLRTVSPSEAGIITLLEPVLNPLWAYLIAPDRETPTMWTMIGGTLLLAALAWRYFPTRVEPQPD
jgi:drug/metabolite transporter, DME family